MHHFLCFGLAIQLTSFVRSWLLAAAGRLVGPDGCVLIGRRCTEMVTNTIGAKVGCGCSSVVLYLVSADDFQNFQH